jgi:pyridinium-3,5-biscarboxylic acid mononucleotide synthase
MMYWGSMDTDKLRLLLTDFQAGACSLEEMLEHLRRLPYEDLGYAQLDLHRALRTGRPEFVFCQGKTAGQVAGIFDRLAQHHSLVLGTRATPEMAQFVQAQIPATRYDPTSRLLILLPNGQHPVDPAAAYILVACAGTADLPVAEEAAQTAELLGCRVLRAYDVGVAGIHRLFDKLALLQSAAVIISVAGMEGALTSVIAGLVACPVIGVPTSVGYGASFEGLSALLSMLNACAPGVTVVNIDNGFGAAVAAHAMLCLAQPTQPVLPAKEVA